MEKEIKKKSYQNFQQSRSYIKVRLRVVSHFSSGIVEQAKREHAWELPHTRKGNMCGVIFTRARVSHTLLSLRKNGGLLVVYIKVVYISMLLSTLHK